MKKAFRILATTVFILLMSVMTVFASDMYKIEGGMITEYSGKESILTIPSKIDGADIIGIEEGAFKNNPYITSVVVSDGIEVIQSRAFENCENLKEIKLPQSMLFVNYQAFYNCYNLNKIEAMETTVLNDACYIDYEKSMLFSDEDYTVENGMIVSYNGTDSVVNIPTEINGQSITAIGASAFEKNTTVTEVTIPDSITYIGEKAFAECSSLKSVKLSDNLSTMGKNIFYKCVSLESVTIPGSVKRVGTYMFNECSGLKSVQMLEGVEDTGINSFYNCTNLESVSLPSTIKKINVWTFGFCKKLSSIDIPDKVTTIESAAFYYCNKLNNIIIPDTVTTIVTHAFRECWSLTNIRLSNKLTSIQAYTFWHCPIITLNIPDSVTKIDKQAFYECKNLSELELPQNLVSIGSGAFYSCSNLQKLTVYEAVTEIADDAFSGCSKLSLRAPEGSYAQVFAVNHDMPNKSLVCFTTQSATEESVTLIATSNLHSYNNVESFGAIYIPQKFYENNRELCVTAEYKQVEEPLLEGESFMTTLKGIPSDWKDVGFIGRAYVKLNDGKYLWSSPYYFTLNEVLKKIK